MKKLCILLLAWLCASPGEQKLVGQGNIPDLSLPWKVGDTWWLHHGAHSNNTDANGNWVGPRSSIDLAPAPGYSGQIRAAHEGFVVPHLCDRKVVIDHGDGWYTGYFHVEGTPQYIRGSDGSVFIQRGTVLGRISDSTDCQAKLDIPHLHFSIRNGSAENHVSIVNQVVGGWKVLDHTYQRYGGLQRSNIEIFRPSGYWNAENDYNPTSTIMNDGMVGNHTCYYDFTYTGYIYDARKVLIAAYNNVGIGGIFAGGASVIVQSRTITSPGFSVYNGKVLFDPEGSPCTSARKQALLLGNQLLDFQAKIWEEDAHLYWEYRDSVPAAYFILERTLDRKNYEFVSKIPANAGRQSYQAVDLKAAHYPNPWVQYRLTLGTPDGREFTQVRLARALTPQKSMQHSPLPFDLHHQANGEIHLQLGQLNSDEACSFQIYDVRGALLKEGEIAQPGISPELNLPVEALSAGVYFIRVAQGNRASSKKFIKY